MSSMNEEEGADLPREGIDIDTGFVVRNLPFTSLCVRGRNRATAGNLISATNCFYEATTNRQDDYDALIKVEAAGLHAAYADVLVRMDGGHNQNALVEAEKALALDPANGTAARAGALASFRLEKLSQASRLVAHAKTLMGPDDTCAGEIDVLAAAVRVATNQEEQRVCAFPDCKKYGRYRCSRCHGAFYCSKEHQTVDWKSHKKACASLKMAVEAKATAKIEQLLKSQGGEGFGGEAAKIAKIMKERMARESNAPRDEQLSIFLKDVEDFCTYSREIKVMPRVWALNASAMADFFERDMGIFTTQDGLQMYMKATDTTRGVADVHKWFETLRRKVGPRTGKSFVVSLAMAAFYGVNFYRSEKNRMVMPVVDDITTAIALGSAHPRYANFVDLLDDSQSTVTGSEHSQDDDEDYDEDCDYGYNNGFEFSFYQDEDDEDWPRDRKVNPESEVQYNDEARSRLLVAVAIGAARSIAVRMEGTPGLLWQGGGMGGSFGL